MKKLCFSIAMSLAFVLGAAAQGLPKTEFQIIGFGGKSGVMYSVDGLNFQIQPQDATKDIKSSIGLGGGAGIGMNINFAPHWGILFGVEAALYQAEFKSDYLAFGYVYKDGNYFLGAAEYIDRVVFNNFKETQKILSAQIPLMLQFNVALNQPQSVHWYIAAGAKLALNLKGSYDTQLTAWRYQADAIRPQLYDEQFTYYDQYDYSRDPVALNWKDRKLKVDLINALASVETGFRFKLGESAGLYLGAYLDYGLMRVAKAEKHKVLKSNVDANTYNSYEAARPAVGFTVKDEGLCSILNSQSSDYVLFVPRPDPDPNMHGPSLNYRNNSKPLAEGANLVSAGVRVRLSFGRHSPKPLPVVAPVKPDTVTVEKIVYLKDTVTVKETVTDTVTVEKTVTVKDTVTVEKVVRDTVVIIKEVPVEIQKVMKDLSNALFKFGSFNLGETEKGYLDTVADWIKSEPEINVEIGGHTDDVGSDDYNQKLSEKRAKAVYDYIISQGVEASRLSYKGYGESEPIATNKTEAGRQRNRRVELKILQ